MSDRPDPKKTALTREERLAARLRENLHRRKAQARSLARMEHESAGSDAAKVDGDSRGLPKSRPES